MKNTFFVETYGCEMNKAESKALTNEMIKIGFKEVFDAEEANWIIVNTCTVRHSAEDRVIGRLGEFKRLKLLDKTKKIALMGCVAQRIKNDDKDKAVFDKFLIDQYIGSFDKQHFISNLGGQKAVTDEGGEYQFFDSYASDDDIRVYIPIMHGCNMKCSYCIVPSVRGKEVYRNRDDIINETISHISNGAKEITFLGQTVNNYRDKIGNFASLLSDISKVKGDVRFKFTSSHPIFFNEELVDVLASDSRFSSHIHLAAQHGSNKILADMARHYTSEKFLELLELIRAKKMNASITTDLMVGYAGESEEDFKELLEFVEKAQFSDAFTYAYSEREGTPAYNRLDKVDEKVKIERIEKLIDLQRGITKQMLSKQVGNKLKVLVIHLGKEDGMLFGYSDENFNVIFKGDDSLVGSFVDVEVEMSKGMTLIAKQI